MSLLSTTDREEIALHRALFRVWATPPGFVHALSSVNHKIVATRMMITSFVFFLIGGIEALIMRTQLIGPQAGVVDPETYNQLFTMHGSTMMFLFAVPFMEGLAIYVVPMMIGARDMAFPRLNAFGYWVFLIAGILLHVALLLGVAPHAGWFNYPPLAGPGYSPGIHVDLWVTMITFLEVSALVAAVELIVTIFRQRAPGMTLARMPLFVWAMLVMAFMILFAMPALIATSLLLALDRFIGTQFFNPLGGGEPVLWQHLFWFFGHPDVYIMLVPALGIVSTIFAASARRPVAVYTLMVLSTAAIGFLSFGLWVHHMYASGLPLMGRTFFAAASMSIAVPSAVQIFAWIATLYNGRPVLHLPALFCIGFLVLFVLGGITGIMVASVPLDLQVHDSYFVVAHFHYVLVGGVVFPIFAAIYFWFPKMTGRMLQPTLGHIHFWTFFLSFNLSFFPMHLLGLQGLPRRVYTYLPDLGFELGNLLATLGAYGMGVGVLALGINLGWSMAFGPAAPTNPWGASTLEWALPSPPPPYNFVRIPYVRSRHPLWDPQSPDDPIAAGMLLDPPGDIRRETLATTAMDAVPIFRQQLPENSLWPLYLALSLTLTVGAPLISLWLVPVGLVLCGISIAGWLWPMDSV